MHRKTVLFISTSIPPFIDSQTIRNVFFLRGLTSDGFQVVVITTDLPGNDQSLSNLMPECTVIRIPASPYFKKILNPTRNFFWKRIQWFFGILSNLFLVPDNHRGWDSIIINYLDKNPLPESPDIIISASGSYTSHIAASFLSEKYQIPFITELGDPWTYNPIWPSSFFYRKLLNKRLELKTLQKVSAISVTTKQTAQIYNKKFSIPERKIHVISMGYSKDEFNNTPLKSGTDAIEITYIGVAYRTDRNIIPLIDSINFLNKKNNFNLNIIGPHSKFFEKHVAKHNYTFVVFKDRVPYEESLNYIKTQGLLVILGNKGGLQIPGKVFMYLASGNPILLISQNTKENDPTWQILKEYRGTFFCRNEKKDITNKINFIIENIEKNHLESKERLTSEKMLSIEWNYIGKCFSNIVRDELK